MIDNFVSKNVGEIINNLIHPSNQNDVIISFSTKYGIVLFINDDVLIQVEDSISNKIEVFQINSYRYNEDKELIVDFNGPSFEMLIGDLDKWGSRNSKVIFDHMGPLNKDYEFYLYFMNNCLSYDRSYFE